MRTMVNLSRTGSLSRQARWAVPAGVMLLVGGVVAGSVVSTAQAAPALPPRTPAQLLASVAEHSAPQPLSGTVVETASLGLPALPGVSGSTSPTSLLSGSHTFRVWFDGPTRYRVALIGGMSETDLVRDGTTAWLWQSADNTVTEATLPRAHGAPTIPAHPPLTPQQVADQAVAAVGPTTDVRVDSNVTVAGQPAYQLDLAPESADSLIGRVLIAVDARHDVPLRVQVFARGATKPAFQVGFTSVMFGPPPAADLAVQPPRGATIVKVNPAAGDAHTGFGSGAAEVIGTGWLTVVDLPRSALSAATSGEGAATGAALGVDAGAVFRDLLNAATPVHGTWGSGRLLHTSLLSLLVTDNGRVLAGAVEPTVLYQAAAQAARTSRSG